MNRTLLTVFVIMIFFLIGVHVVVFFPYMIDQEYDISSVADSVSGFTAPILSLFGSLLLYLALLKQSEANEKVQMQIDLSEEVVYFDYFLKCQSEWRLNAYKNRGNLQQPLPIEEPWLYLDIAGLISSLFKSENTRERKNRTDLLNKYCSRQIPAISRVVNALTAGLENISSGARRETLLVELDIFNMQTLSKGDIAFLRGQIEHFLECNEGFAFIEFFELLDLFESLWFIADRTTT